MDHAGRRRDIVDAFLTVARRDGLAQSSSRAVANELGLAVGGLWHYFDDFDQVVAAAFEQVNAATIARIRDAVRDLDGLSALRAMMRELLPIDAVTQQEAPVVVNFWGRVALSPSLGRAQRSIASAWRDELHQHLAVAKQSGAVRGDAPVGLLADLLLSITISSQVEFVADPAGWEHEQGLGAVDRLLESWVTR